MKKSMRIMYIRQEVMNRVIKDIQDGKYDIMFIMNPVRVEQIRNITAMGERLPEVTISVFPRNRRSV